MSASTNAILFYGVCFDEEDHQWPWEKSVELEWDNNTVTRVATARTEYGIYQYTGPRGGPYRLTFTPVKGTPEHLMTSDEESVRYRADSHASELDEGTEPKIEGITIDTHCMASCPMGYIALTETVQVASRGNPVKVGSVRHGELTIKGGLDPFKRLRDACEIIGYTWDEVKDKIGWWLVSDYHA